MSMIFSQSIWPLVFLDVSDSVVEAYLLSLWPKAGMMVKIFCIIIMHCGNESVKKVDFIVYFLLVILNRLLSCIS